MGRSRPFAELSFSNEVFMNDIISLADEYGQSQLYQVEAIDIVDASQGELPVLAHDSALVLITCYSYINTSNNSNNSNERYVITAKLL
jgi:sortase A